MLRIFIIKSYLVQFDSKITSKLGLLSVRKIREKRNQKKRNISVCPFTVPKMINEIYCKNTSEILLNGQYSTQNEKKKNLSDFNLIDNRSKSLKRTKKSSRVKRVPKSKITVKKVSEKLKLTSLI